MSERDPSKSASDLTINPNCVYETCDSARPCTITLKVALDHIACNLASLERLRATAENIMRDYGLGTEMIDELFAMTLTKLVETSRNVCGTDSELTFACLYGPSSEGSFVGFFLAIMKHLRMDVHRKQCRAARRDIEATLSLFAASKLPQKHEIDELREYLEAFRKRIAPWERKARRILKEKWYLCVKDIDPCWNLLTPLFETLGTFTLHPNDSSQRSRKSRALAELRKIIQESNLSPKDQALLCKIFRVEE